MAKRYRASVAPAPLKGMSPGVPMGKATHTVRVMHRECVTRTAKDRFKLGSHAYAVVEYRGSRPVRVKGAANDVKSAHAIAYRIVSVFDRAGDPANVRELHLCRAVPAPKKADNKATRQELHVAEIDRLRTCRVCGERDKSKLCKPRGVSRIERNEAQRNRTRIVEASKSDDTRPDPNIITRWTKAAEERWA